MTYSIEINKKECTKTSEEELVNTQAFRPRPVKIEKIRIKRE